MAKVTVENPKQALGAKRVPLGLLPAVGVIEGAKAMEFGAYHAGNKHTGYGPYNFRDTGSIDLMMYLDAIERHILRLRDGEDFAPDSKVHHMGHIIADAAIVLDALYNGNLKDNRPSAGSAAKVLDAFERTNEPKDQSVCHPEQHPAGDKQVVSGWGSFLPKTERSE